MKEFYTHMLPPALVVLALVLQHLNPSSEAALVIYALALVEGKNLLITKKNGVIVNDDD
tara:strand:- start:2215 stop:2391 length:177 start_codon:yes stop_codon:yes gene_type:complete